MGVAGEDFPQGACKLFDVFVGRSFPGLLWGRAEQGGNVTAVHYEHAGEGSDVNGCYIGISMETRNFAHIEAIKKSLKDNGFKIV